MDSLMPFVRVLNPLHADFGLAVFVVMVMIVVSTLVAVSRSRLRFRATRLQDLPAGLASSGRREDVEDHLRGPLDAFAESAPTLLITVGLLGTFIGLAVSIESASDLLRGDGGGGVDSEHLGRLSLLLGGIGLKFKSSAWGILGSIAVRPVVYHGVTLPRRRRAEALAIQYEAHVLDMEHERHSRDREAREARDKGLLELLGEIHAALEGARVEARAALAMELEARREGTDRAVNSVREKVDEVRRGIAESNRGLGEVKGSVDKLSDSMLTVPASITGIRVASGKMDSAASGLQKGVSKMNSDLNVLFDRVMKSHDESSKILGAAAKESGAAISKSTDDMLVELKGALSNQNVVHREGVKSLKTASDSIAESTKSVSSTIENVLKEQGKSQRVAMDSMQGVMKESGDVMKNAVGGMRTEVAEALKSMTDAQGRGASEFASSSAKSMGALRVALEKVEKALDQQRTVAEEMHDGAEHMREHVGTMASQFKEAAESIKSAMGQLAAAEVKKQVTTLLQINDTLTELAKRPSTAAELIEGTKSGEFEQVPRR